MIREDEKADATVADQDPAVGGIAAMRAILQGQDDLSPEQAREALRRLARVLAPQVNLEIRRLEAAFG